MSSKVSLENVLRRCGDFGRFQFLHYAFMSLFSVATGITTYYYVFGAAEPLFRCRLPSSIWPYEDKFEPINDTHRDLIEEWSSKSSCYDYNKSLCTDFVYDCSVFGRTFTEDANFICDKAVERTWLSTSYQAGGYKNKYEDSCIWSFMFLRSFVMLLTGMIGDIIGRRKMIQILTIVLYVVCFVTQILMETVTMSVQMK